LSIARTHDLKELLKGLVPHHAELRQLRRGAVFLFDYPVEFRYPGRCATTRQMKAALRWAGRMRLECRRLLGIREKRQPAP
jgi:hypothetical protein